MYRIIAANAGEENLVVYDDTQPDKRSMAVSPKLTLTAGGAGSLTMTLPQGAAGYDSIQRLTTSLYVLRDGAYIWSGRVLTETRDFWGSRELFCEGALAFLNDTVPMVSNPSLASVLNAHNAKVGLDRQILPGTAAYGGITAEADGSSGLDLVNKLVSEKGGVLQMVYNAIGAPTLNWLASYPEGDQYIEFGKNLLEFTRNWDSTEFATYCYVRGHKNEETGQYANSGWRYLPGENGNPAPKDLYGRIEHFIDNSNIEQSSDCQTEADNWLRTQQFDNMQLELTALDLHILNPEVAPLELLDKIYVTSWAHGMSREFAVIGMDIPLDDPGNTRYTLGDAEIARKPRVYTLTQKQVASEQEQRDYADMAADGAADSAIYASNTYTNGVKTTLETADGVIRASVTAVDEKASSAKMTAEAIEATVEDPNTGLAAVRMTANEIKGQVTDSEGHYTVANLLPDGFHVGDATGVTYITGSMIRVNELHGNTIYIYNSNGTWFASLSEYNGRLYISSNGGITFGDPIHVWNASSIVFDGIIGPGDYPATLQNLLDQKQNVIITT